MTNKNPQARCQFPLGRIVSTPAALDALARSGDSAFEFFHRHASGDWGDVGAEDRAANESALANGERLMSVYRTAKNEVIWLMTEADRSSTCILTPDDY